MSIDEPRRKVLKMGGLAIGLAGMASATGLAQAAATRGENSTKTSGSDQDLVARAVRHKKITVDGVEIFYRVAGPAAAPALLLLHGFPTSSHMFRHLIPALADRYRVIAPDYPAFGNSAFPSRERFSYSFDAYAKLMANFTDAIHLSKYAMYIQDYGAPIGLRLALFAT